MDLVLVADNAGAKQTTPTSKDNKPFSITSISSTKNVISAGFDPNEKLTEIVLQPKVNVELLKNTLKGNLTIELTHPEVKQVVAWF